jgi:hypothetical protein
VESLGIKFLTNQWEHQIRPLTKEETDAYNGIGPNGEFGSVRQS